MPRKASTSSAKEFFPEKRSLKSFRQAAAGCKACDLWKGGTQTVFGEGARRPDVLFVGEQPGNEEDLTGRPFFGPAGRLLNEALEEAGIDRSQTYVTNVVKHFKWDPGASVVFTKSQMQGKSQRADPGSKPRLP